MAKLIDFRRHAWTQVTLALVGAIATLGTIAPRASANLQEVQVRYGPIGISATMSDMEAFAANKPVSDGFASNLGLIERFAGIDPDRLRNYLTFELNLKAMGVDTNKISSMAYGFIGKRVLGKVATVLYPPYMQYDGDSSNEGSILALRGAIVTSLSDGKISAIELLRNYGPPAMRVDLSAAMGLKAEAQELIQQVRDSFK